MSNQENILILFADKDQALCSSVSLYLAARGIATLLAHDGEQIVDILEKEHPCVIITDLMLPCGENPEFLKTIKTRYSIPVIIAADINSTDTVSTVFSFGVFDYILKPYILDVLYRRIIQALQSVGRFNEKTILSELTLLHTVSCQMATTHNIDELFDIIFSNCFQISGAECGLLQLLDKENHELVLVRQRGIETVAIRTSLYESGTSLRIKNVCETGKSVCVPEAGSAQSNLPIDSNGDSILCAPISVSGETMAVVTLYRQSECPFTIQEQNMLDMLVSQAGVAISNANLYASVNQKLNEVMLISTYSEGLMGMVDKYDVIKSLFVTSIDNFPIDFIGFLILQRRNHEFLYWSKGNIDDTSLQEICKNVIIDFNAEASTRIHEQRVAIRRMPLQSAINGNVKGPLKFKYMIPVCLDNLKFGAVLFGSFKDIKNENEKKTMLSSLVSQTRIALANSKLYSDMKENYIRTIKALAIAVDAKDTYTHGHSENVMNIAEEIAREMGIDEKGIGIIRDAGLLHDIGKIGIPGYILNKPGPLTYEEFNGIMKTHSTLGANIVKDVPFLRDLHKLILYHHEHFDGGGYPDNLKGEQIPVGARILHVADAFEAMTSNRPYRNSLGKSEAFRRLTECSGKQFDPEVIDAFLRLAKKKGWIEEMNV